MTDQVISFSTEGYGRIFFFSSKSLLENAIAANPDMKAVIGLDSNSQSIDGVFAALQKNPINAEPVTEIFQLNGFCELWVFQTKSALESVAAAMPEMIVPIIGADKSSLDKDFPNVFIALRKTGKAHH